MTATVDLRDPDFVDDPYPVLAALRDAGPMQWHEPSGRWLATTHAAVGQVLRSRALGRLWSDWEPVEQMAPFNALHRHQMMESEDQAHSRLRRLVSGAFSRGHVERMRPRILELVDAQLDRLAAAADSEGVVDLLAEYAEPLPVFVIADLLGVPRDDHAQLRAWSQAIVHMYEQDVDESTREAAVAASVAFSEYVRDLLRQRRRSPGDDLVSDLLAERTDGSERLSDDELVASVVLLLNAGHEASVNVFGNGVHALLSHREQLDRVTSAQVPAATALEELIRYDAPLQLFERTATRDVEICDLTVRAGDVVACLMGSANRDGAVFTKPDVLDVGRDPNPHVGFGMGLHFCLGAPLARLELEITLDGLLRRHPALRLAGPAPRRGTWVLRGFDRLDVHLEGS